MAQSIGMTNICDQGKKKVSQVYHEPSQMANKSTKCTNNYISIHCTVQSR